MSCGLCFGFGGACITGDVTSIPPTGTWEPRECLVCGKKSEGMLVTSGQRSV